MTTAATDIPLAMQARCRTQRTPVRAITAEGASSTEVEVVVCRGGRGSDTGLRLAWAVLVDRSGRWGIAQPTTPTGIMSWRYLRSTSTDPQGGATEITTTAAAFPGTSTSRRTTPTPRPTEAEAVRSSTVEVAVAGPIGPRLMLGTNIRATAPARPMIKAKGATARRADRPTTSEAPTVATIAATTGSATRSPAGVTRAKKATGTGKTTTGKARGSGADRRTSVRSRAQNFS
mmetsp:Transcript_3189/g.7503  ORF Transcript_3189/g.7503 Transcript_3189/m.7503 type:complete len:232 (+) Transcript_3189:1612-2307(+)